MVMRRVVFALFCFCVLAAFAIPSIPAQAGGYYSGGGYYGSGYYGQPSYGDQVWYSSSCCYRKIVRHERSVRYEPVFGGNGYYGSGYYGRPYPYYAPRHYYGRPYRYGYYDLGPRRYVNYGPGYYSGPRGICYTAGPYGGTVCN
jgi:hypothetical protein